MLFDGGATIGGKSPNCVFKCQVAKKSWKILFINGVEGKEEREKEEKYDSGTKEIRILYVTGESEASLTEYPGQGPAIQLSANVSTELRGNRVGIL